MLKQVELNSIPMPIKKLSSDTVFNEKLVSIKHLLDIKNIQSIDVINQNSTIEVLSAFMYNSRNPKIQPITVSVRPGITSIEILNDPLVQLLPCVFNDIRIVVQGNDIINLWIKGLLDEAIEAFKNLHDKQLIDLCLRTLLRKDENDSFILINKAYMITSSNYFSHQEIVDLILRNKLFMYLITQCILNNNFYSIPLPVWGKDEIENERYFNDLASVFKNVYILGSGEPWVSTYLIISQPYENIVQCLFN